MWSLAYESFFIAAELPNSLGITFLDLVMSVEMKLFSHDELEAKPGCAQFKEAAPRVRLSCPENTPFSHDGKSVPKDLLQLSQLVGNPNTAEHVWMNACIGAGDRSLAPKHGFIFKALNSFKTSLGVTYGMLTIMFNFILVLSVAAQAAFLTIGLSIDDFIRPFSHLDGAGLLIALMAGVCFWVSLLSMSKALKWFYLVVSMLGLSLFLIFGTSELLGYGWAIVTAALSMAGVIGIWHSGAFCREALPKSFSVTKLAQSSLGVLTPPAVLSAWLLYMAVTATTHSTTYNNGSSSTMWILGSVFSYCLLAQGYAIARASKSASKSACAFLGVYVQAPLLMGLFYSASVSALIATTANLNLNSGLRANVYFDSWMNEGPERAIFMFAVTLLTLALAGAGGCLGAWRNLVLSRAKH